MIDRYHLRYFLAVVECGTFSRAASQVNVAQPTLSIGIAKLERELGAKVFLRNSQRVELTDAGARLLAHARTIEREFDALSRATAEPQARRVVRLGILSTLPNRLVEAIVVHNRTGASPDALEIVEGSERDLLARLQRRRLDLALTIIRPGQEEWRPQPLFRERYVLAMPAWHALAGEASIAPGALAQEVMIVRRHCEVLAETSRHFTEHGVRPRFSLRTTNDERALAMVRAGLGITVMPESFAEPGIAMPRLEGFRHERRIGLLWNTPDDRLPRDCGAVAALLSLARPA